MEISDTSLDRDRLAKKRIYAEARIPRYWLLDLNERKLEVYSEPRGDEYAGRAKCEAQEALEVVLDGHVAGAVSVMDLLP